MFRKTLIFVVLTGLVNALAPGFLTTERQPIPKTAVDLKTSVEAPDPTSRRSCLGVLASASLALVTAPAAQAFDNKISNKYDDRPKRRGPKVSEKAQPCHIGGRNCLDVPNSLYVFYTMSHRGLYYY